MAVKKLSLCGSENSNTCDLENIWPITLLDHRACDTELLDKEDHASVLRRLSMSLARVSVRLRLTKLL